MSDDESAHEEEAMGHDDQDEFDEKNHASLLRNIVAMDGKVTTASQRREASSMSEHHAPTGRDQVKLHELVGALKTKPKHGELKKQISRVRGKEKVLNVPLSKPQQERVHRGLAYEKVTKEVSKWDSVVHKNRQAEQLKFPLEQPDFRVHTSADDLAKRTKPGTSMELEIAAMLGESGHTMDIERELTPAEEKALQAMSLEEARERRAELQKYRALLSYKEAKARRQKKIKSKKYHRILNKEKLKKEKKTLEELEKTDPEAFAERLQKLDSDRMKERVSLKHRGGSKFAKQQVMYNKYSDRSREAVQDMLMKSRELSKKVAVEEESSEDEEEIEEVVVDEKTSGNSLNPWMSSGIKISKRKNLGSMKTPAEDENTDDSDSEVEEEVVSVKQAAKDVMNVNIDSLFDHLEAGKIKTVRQMKRKAEDDSEDDLEGSEDEDEDEVQNEDDSRTKVVEITAGDSEKSSISMSLKRKRTMQDFDENEDKEPNSENEDEDTTKELPEKKAKPDDKSKPVKESEPLSVDPTKFLTLGGKSNEMLLAEDDSGDDNEDQSLTIAQAFAADDVVEEFREEKQSMKDRDKPKDIDLTLPGWGAWGGDEIKVSKRHRKRFTIKAAPTAPRRDRDLNNVIISETKDTTVSKHQVNQLPFPFANPDQFESSIRQPIGKTWNPETAYKKLIQPKKVTRMGTVIAPIDKSQVVSKGKEKGPEKRKKRVNKRPKKE